MGHNLAMIFLQIGERWFLHVHTTEKPRFYGYVGDGLLLGLPQYYASQRARGVIGGVWVWALADSASC